MACFIASNETMMIGNNMLVNNKNKNWESIGQAAVIALAFFIPISTAITSALVIVILTAWAFGSNYAMKRDVLLKHPLSSWVFMFALITLLGMLYSSGDNKMILRSMVDILRLALIPILIYYYQPKGIANAALWAFVFAMLITLVLAFLKIYAGFPIGLKYTTGGVFKSHIKTSYFMAIAAFFLAFKMTTLPSSFRGLAIIGIMLMMYYLLFMNVGRIGYITLVFCFLLLAWQWYRIKGLILAIALAIMMVSGAYFSSPLFKARINLLAQDLESYQQGNRSLESSLGSRLQFANSSTELITQKPILGWGTGSYSVAYATLFEGQNTLLTDNPHNEYLRIGVELGLLGLCLLLLFFYQQWRLSKLLPEHIKGFCQGILLTFMIGCLFNSWLKDFTEGYFYCLMSAICFSALPAHAQKVQVKATLH